MKGEGDGLISDLSVLLDKGPRTFALVKLCRDKGPDPSESFENHHLLVAASAGDQCSLWTALDGRQDKPKLSRL